MAFIFPLTLVVILFIAYAMISSKKGGVPGLTGGRVLARGLVLSASSYSSGERTQGGQRYEMRDLVLDVEIPGQAPYEVSVTPLIPRICEGRPGSAFDLAVNPRSPNDIVIIGPAGSSAWLGAAPWLTGQGIMTGVPGIPGVPGTGGPNVVGRALLGLIGVLFGFGVIGAMAGRHAPPAAHTASTQPAGHTLSPACEAATRCCKVLGGSCTQFATMDNIACARTLQTEQAAATRAHKSCP